MSGHWHADEEADRVELLIGRRVDGVVILTGNMTDGQILEVFEAGADHRLRPPAGRRAGARLLSG
ncbi:hypothetical protein LP419_33905 [Massilia sp. H-1]|nr:hypothetical protein LP419_33905 [Massilia sp. H-1]